MAVFFINLKDMVKMMIALIIITKILNHLLLALKPIFSHIMLVGSGAFLILQTVPAMLILL